MNLSLQNALNQASLLFVPIDDLRQAYRRMRVAAKPVRRLVDNPNKVSRAVPPAVQAYLPAVDALIEALTALDLTLSNGGIADAESKKSALANRLSKLVAHLTDQQEAAEATAKAAIAAGQQSEGEELSNSTYQTYAALYNTCVDAYLEVVDSRSQAEEALHQSGLKLYHADLGTWTRGIVVDIVAENSAAALEQAYQALDQAQLDQRLPDDDEQMVVQLHCFTVSTQTSHLVWDFFNGMYH